MSKIGSNVMLGEEGEEEVAHESVSRADFSQPFVYVAGDLVSALLPSPRRDPTILTRHERTRQRPGELIPSSSSTYSWMTREGSRSGGSGAANSSMYMALLRKRKSAMTKSASPKMHMTAASSVPSTPSSLPS